MQNLKVIRRVTAHIKRMAARWAGVRIMEGGKVGVERLVFWRTCEYAQKEVTFNICLASTKHDAIFQ